MWTVEYPLPKILNALQSDNLLPAIVFRTSRKQCDHDVSVASNVRKIILSQAEQNEIQASVLEVLGKYNIEQDVILTHPQYEALVKSGVGAHHAGQLLGWRLLLEELMTRGMMRIMVATGTVAAGVDFPARTVVITAHSKRGSEGFNVLTSSELQQMSGRAGRRGKDAVGFCIVAPSQFSDARVIYEVLKRPLEPLRSAYYASPSTVLNLLKFRNVDDLRYTVQRSLASFLDRKNANVIMSEAEGKEIELKNAKAISHDGVKKTEKKIKRMRVEAENLKTRQLIELEKSLGALKALGYISETSLTDKGIWAAELCTSLVLELSESIEAGLFDDLTCEELAALVGSISGDTHRVYFNLKRNPISKDKFSLLQDRVDYVRQVYDNPVMSDVKVLPDAALTVLTWLESDNWSEFSALLKLGSVADGDVARLVTQTADHLNQISKLFDSHPELSRLAAEARRKLLRPPVAEGAATDEE